MENNLLTPSIKYILKIIEFFGYVSFDTSTMSVVEKIVAHHQLPGLNQEKLVLCSENTYWINQETESSSIL